MSRYLSPSHAKLEAKGVASVRSRVVNLRELRPELTAHAMADGMEDAFQTVYGLRAERLEERELDSGRIDALIARNAGWEWLFGRELACTLRCGDRFAWGEAELRLAVEGGVIAQAAVYTDAMDWTLAPAVEGALTGCRFRLEEMGQRLRAAALEDRVREDLCRLLARQNI